MTIKVEDVGRVIASIDQISDKIQKQQRLRTGVTFTIVESFAPPQEGASRLQRARVRQLAPASLPPPVRPVYSPLTRTPFLPMYTATASAAEPSPLGEAEHAALTNLAALRANLEHHGVAYLSSQQALSKVIAQLQTIIGTKPFRNPEISGMIMNLITLLAKINPTAFRLQAIADDEPQPCRGPFACWFGMS